MVEADPDVGAAMDILSFALYHENNQVIEDNSLPLADKRKRDEPVTPVGSDEENSDTEETNAKRQREEIESAPAVPTNLLNDAQQSIYEEVSKSLEGSVDIEEVCDHIEDRNLVKQAAQLLHDDGKIYISDGILHQV